jgi:hypothetical protein
MGKGTKSGRAIDSLPASPGRLRSASLSHPLSSQAQVATLAKPTAAVSRKSKRQPSDTVKPEKSTALPTDAARKTGDEFGIEGTNKTVATPKPDNAPSDELGLGPHVEKTPYTRG